MKNVVVTGVVVVVVSVFTVIGFNSFLLALDREECFRVQRMVEAYRNETAFPSLYITAEERMTCDRVGFPVRGI